jgi:hypothetical protein
MACGGLKKVSGASVPSMLSAWEITRRTVLQWNEVAFVVAVERRWSQCVSGMLSVWETIRRVAVKQDGACCGGRRLSSFAE